jgi:hypothetical protein
MNRAYRHSVSWFRPMGRRMVSDGFSAVSSRFHAVSDGFGTAKTAWFQDGFGRASETMGRLHAVQVQPCQIFQACWSLQAT